MESSEAAYGVEDEKMTTMTMRYPKMHDYRRQAQ
jgi:hypothetical protein